MHQESLITGTGLGERQCQRKKSKNDAITLSRMNFAVGLCVDHVTISS